VVEEAEKMKVILNKRLENLGDKNEVVEVKRGYARNFLFPRRLAEPATPASLKRVEERKKVKVQKEEEKELKTEELEGKLKDLTLTLAVKSGEEGKLYGSVTSSDLSSALEKEVGIKLDKRKIEVSEPIKRLGVHSVHLRLAKGKTVNLRVEIVSSEQVGA